MIGLFKQPGMVDHLFKTAGLPGIGEDAKLVDLDQIHPALPPRPKPAKKKHAVM